MDASLGDLIGGSLRLDRAAFEAIELAPHGLRTALLIMLLAGMSETLGQCVVLVLNRVSRTRFFVALGLGGLELAGEAVLWIGSVWVLAGILGADRPSLASATRVVGLAYAPLLFGFLIFLPYLGPLIARVLRVWVLLGVVLGISVVFGVPPLAAAIAASAGFLVRWALLRALSWTTHVLNGLFRHPAAPTPPQTLALSSADRQR